MTAFRKFFPKELVIDSPRLSLRLMEKDDASAFYPLCTSHDLWKYFVRDLSTAEGVDRFVADSLSGYEREAIMPFTIIDNDSGRICGSTSLINISFQDLRLEIGAMWIGKNFQGTGINRSSFFLLYSYAFEVMQMQRVEAKTDRLNEQARAALLKVGMIPEGVLRSHTLMHDGRRRDTLYFSMLKPEWPGRSESFFSEFL